ncbi:MAG TPA: hypothetical protein DGD08_07700 [Gemmatimonas aurantiaca]|uniref:Uncharacterized protein n=2 Tax=Gemmatimonas aurantiaca TaxID=173480 RepID=C1A7V2_GEMAT|nr:hypothetical protein [Gemmatimonas aurantiaca]BAH38312.1 hypothetical protein GAU_1270 [Gemmatimonas aurantiaca T-27]HCT57084.1 hypothetical protein [Gemmatimonas aurantiaca]
MDQFFEWVEARTGSPNPHTTRSFEFSVRRQQDGQYSVGIGGVRETRYVGAVSQFPEWMVPWLFRATSKGTGILISEYGQWRAVLS